METLTMKSKNLKEVKALNEPTLKTGNELFDKWFSKDGGLVVPSCVLLSGDSGSGKTTIMINLMKWLKNHRTSMYSREMKDYSVKDQTKNVVFDHDNAFIADEDTCPTFDSYMQELEVIQPKVVIIDSLQAITGQDFPNMSEEDAELYVVSQLRKWVERTKGCVILVCHNTKEGDYKGSSGIKQFLDAHAVTRFNLVDKSRKIYFEKNRKGPVGELFYNFEDAGVVFYTPEQWTAKTAKSRNFSDTVTGVINSYLETVNKKADNYESFKKDYNFAMKSIESITDGGQYLAETVKIITELSAKYEL